MSIGISFYAFRKDTLASAPPAVRKWIDDFCEEKEIHGIPYLVTIGTDDKSPWNCMEDEEYEEGLTEEELADCGVFTWFSNHPEVVFEYYWS